MYKLKKLLVCIDLTEMDEFVVKYAALIATTMESDGVYFFHSNDDRDLPKAVREKYPQLYNPEGQDLVEKMEKTVIQYFPDYKAYNSQFILKEGRASRQILRWSEIGEMDLIIMGNKSELKGKGVNPAKIANVSHCSVLFVPEGVTMQMNKLLVPIDFSKRSKAGVDQALEIQKRSKAEITLQHVFVVPHGYHYTGKSSEEFSIIMRENAKKDYSTFLKQNAYDSSKFKDIYTLDDDDVPADKIYLEALNSKVDLIIISSRGRTKAASMLLGSLTLELLKLDRKVPCMIVKDKQENMSFFKALMNI